MAAELGPTDAPGALGRLDALAAELELDPRSRSDAEPEEQSDALADLLGGVHGFAGDSDHYDQPHNSMLDRVLDRRRGLPILLSVVYAEVARRADLPIAGVGLPGHYVVAHFGADPPLVLDPFGGGTRVISAPETVALVRPWSPHETVMRMLNNLVGSYRRRGDLPHALHAAQLRLLLPADDGLRETLEHELKVLRARLN